jgi:hypothetical protein
MISPEDSVRPNYADRNGCVYMFNRDGEELEYAGRYKIKTRWDR